MSLVGARQHVRPRRRLLASVAAVVLVLGLYHGGRPEALNDERTLSAFACSLRAALQGPLVQRSLLGSAAAQRARTLGRCAGAAAEGGDDDILRRVFFQMDTDGNGLIDQAEFATAMQGVGSALDKLTPQEVEEIFKIADADGDGFVNLEDFGKWITITKENFAYWQLVDTDFDGQITQEEWRTVVAKMELNLAPESVEQSFKRADINKDGFMSFVEFFKYMNGIEEEEAGFFKRVKGWVGRKLR
mmetsp:Transcript_65372/g.181345  ORF Transcript_65372/g.181345 Transcript_65372/m.181345 type:complete len:245 (-) Transcript_65372:123-857(-)